MTFSTCFCALPCPAASTGAQSKWDTASSGIAIRHHWCLTLILNKPSDMCSYSTAQNPGEPQNYLTQSPTCFSGYCISSEHIISPEDSQTLVCLLTAREFVNILDGRCSVGALLGWKGRDPEMQDAANTADLAEGTRGHRPEPLLCPALAVSTPQTPVPSVKGALYPCTLLPPAHTVPVLLCAALQAALGSQPGGRVPPQWWEKCLQECTRGWDSLLALTHALSCCVSLHKHFHPLENLTALWSSSPSWKSQTTALVQVSAYPQGKSVLDIDRALLAC